MLMLIETASMVRPADPAKRGVRMVELQGVGPGFPLYGTVAIIVLAHTINWIAYGTRTTNSVMIQVHRELEEAGRVSGASSPRVLWKIVLPLIAAGVLNSWVWIGMLSYRPIRSL